MPSNRRKTKAAADTNACIDSAECPNNPDLILLRNAAIDERNAIALYLEAAENTCLSELFLSVAEDEMSHYIEIMRQISRLDPIQAEAFRNAGLNVLTFVRPVAIKNKWACNDDTDDDDTCDSPSDDDLETIQYLTRAITAELESINTYQIAMNKAQTRPVRELFCQLMNDEKIHLAQFTAALFDLTHEPIQA